MEGGGVEGGGGCVADWGEPAEDVGRMMIHGFNYVSVQRASPPMKYLDTPELNHLSERLEYEGAECKVHTRFG